MTLLQIYFVIAGIFGASALPVFIQGIPVIFDRDESSHNRGAAAIWTVVIPLLCVAWPLFLLAIAGSLTSTLARKLLHRKAVA